MSPSVTIDACVEALGTFLAQYLPAGAVIVQADVNRVSMPAAPCAVITPLFTRAIETPQRIDHGLSLDMIMPSQVDLQVDLYGDGSGDWCRMIDGSFKSSFAASLFPATVSPLYTDGGRLSPQITGEQQYLIRWVLTVSLQYNPQLTASYQSALALTANLKCAEVEFPI